MQPNMKKEYRAELKLLRKNRRVAQREFNTFIATMRRKARGIMDQLDPIIRDVKKIERKTKSTVARYDKRIAILEGRLS